MAEIFEERLVAAPSHEVVRLLREPGEWLEEAAAAAGHGGEAVTTRMRSELSRGALHVKVSKRARLEIGMVNRVRDHYVIPITWQADGFAGLFPVMDAIVEVHPAGREHARIVFWGRYDPPLGRMGDLVDRFIAHRAAGSTVGALLSAMGQRAEEHVARSA